MPIQQKDVLESDLNDHIIRLIHRLTISEKRKLIEILESGHLDIKRRNPRRPCFIVANYAADNLSGTDIIYNISVSGAYIETREDFRVGQEILLNLGNSQNRKIQIIGEVVRVSATGIGVEFKKKFNPNEK